MYKDPQHPRLRRWTFPAAFAFAMLAVLTLLLLRNRGLYPVVFADEWLYSQAARLQPLRDSVLPSYLYLGLFSFTSACGTGFLECARVLNAVLFVAAAPFVYLVARTVAGKPVAALIALCAMLAPASSYTAYFMPESAYFLCFWILSWLMLTVAGAPTLAFGLAAGAVLGLMSLVKVHALFLLPACAAYLLWLGWSRAAPKAGLAAALALAAATLAVKAAVAYALAGPAGLNLLGSFYGNHASNSGGGAFKLLSPLLHNLHGHAMALTLLFAVPLLACAAAACSREARQALASPGRGLLMYTLLTLGAAVAMTAAYTASIADAGPQEGVRLHQRYYDFVFPLLTMAGAMLAAAAPASLPRRLALALPCVLLLGYAWQALLPAYPLSFIDGPELFSVAREPTALLLVTLLQAAVIGLWLFRPVWGRLAFLGLVLPCFTIGGLLAISGVLQHVKQPNSYDVAALAARSALQGEPSAGVSVAGDSLAGLARAQFHLDRGDTSTIVLAAGAALEAAQLPVRKQYLLVVGQHALPLGAVPIARSPDYTLLRVGIPNRSLHLVDFAQPLGSGALAELSGMADQEHWGRWSNGGQVGMRFSQPLPADLVLFLKGRAFGPNVGRQFVLRVGGASQSFKLPAGDQELVFRLRTDGRQDRLSIDVPQPASPLELGAGNDARKLGLGLINMEIGAAEAP